MMMTERTISLVHERLYWRHTVTYYDKIEQRFSITKKRRARDRGAGAPGVHARSACATQNAAKTTGRHTAPIASHAAGPRHTATLATGRAPAAALSRKGAGRPTVNALDGTMRADAVDAFRHSVRIIV